MSDIVDYDKIHCEEYDDYLMENYTYRIDYVVRSKNIETSFAWDESFDFNHRSNDKFYMCIHKRFMYDSDNSSSDEDERVAREQINDLTEIRSNAFDKGYLSNYTCWWYHDEKNKKWIHWSYDLKNLNELIYLQNALWNKLIEKRYKKYWKTYVYLSKKLPIDIVRHISGILEDKDFKEHAKHMNRLVMPY